MPKDSMCFTCSSGNYDSLGIKPDFSKREQVRAKI
jgi:amidophosphoribosyltransferase